MTTEKEKEDIKKFHDVQRWHHDIISLFQEIEQLIKDESYIETLETDARFSVKVRQIITTAGNEYCKTQIENKRQRIISYHKKFKHPFPKIDESGVVL